MRPLAVTSPERVSVLKDVPTFAEIGYPELGGAIWFWLIGPKGLPTPIVDKSEPDERMAGLPITRQTTADGRWAYTLYDGAGKEPFVHALDTVNGEAH